MIFPDLSSETIKKVIAEERIDVWDQHEKIIEKEKDFYEDRQALDKYLKNWGFKRDDGQTDLPLQTVNLTKKVIEKISLTYKKQPVRTSAEEIEDGEDDPVRDWYNSYPEFGLGYKYSERYKNLLGKVLRRAHYDPLRNKWYQFIETVYQPHFLEDNVLHPVAFSYPVGHNLSKLSSEDDWWMFWSDDEIFYYIPGSNEVRYDEYGGVNPFGIMPMVEDRSDYPVDQYQTVGALSLVHANQNINIALNDLNLMIHFQAFDQAVASGVNKDDIPRLKIGPNKITVLSDTEANLDFLTRNPKITECIEAIKFNIQTVAYTYNLAINWSIEGNPASGFSLMVQNIDLLEARQDDVDLAILGEKKMFEIIKKMQSYYQRFNMLGKEEPIIPESVNLKVDFEEIDFPINQAEELAMRDWNIEHNVKTDVDYIMADNPDMSFEDALQKFYDNKKINGKLSARDVIGTRIEEAGGEVLPGQEPAT